MASRIPVTPGQWVVVFSGQGVNVGCADYVTGLLGFEASVDAGCDGGGDGGCCVHIRCHVRG